MTDAAPTDADPANLIVDIIGGLSRFAALAVLADLGAADHLRDRGPLTPTELAVRCGADASALGRVLRELASVGVVASASDGRYALTPAGATLCTDGSMRAGVLMNAHPTFRYGMDQLPTTVRQGRSAFADHYGGMYECLRDDAELSRLFDAYMYSRAVPLIEAAASLHDYGGIGTLVDVGGGNGHYLRAILPRYPELRAVLFDVDHVIAAAREAIADAGLAERCECVAGNFFADVPPDGDAYLLSSVLHNWSDEACVRILQNVRKAMAPGGRVLILEYVLPDGDAPHVGKDIDMRMLALFTDAPERSRHEYAELLAQADLRIHDVTDLPNDGSIVDARAV